MTVPELERYRKLCNFLDDELVYFNMKARDKSNLQVAAALNVSEAQVPRIGARVREKMRRIGDLPDSFLIEN